MATLNEVMKDTADAIREKTGKSDLIAPVDFASEIKGITAGGGDAPSGGSNWKYWDFTGYKDDIFAFIESIPTLAHNVRVIINGAEMIVPFGIFTIYEISQETLTQIKAIGVDMSAKVRNHPLAPTATTMGEVFSTDLGGITLEQCFKDIWGLVEITEDEFLNKTFE
jgi:hypothetical protein